MLTIVQGCKRQLKLKQTVLPSHEKQSDDLSQKAPSSPETALLAIRQKLDADKAQFIKLLETHYPAFSALSEETREAYKNKVIQAVVEHMYIMFTEIEKIVVREPESTLLHEQERVSGYLH